MGQHETQNKLEQTVVQELKTDTWNTSFIQTTDLFWPIRPAFQQLPINENEWPTLNNYNLFLQDCFNENKKEIAFVNQGSAWKTFEDEYEPRIFITGEVQTRLNNWHDFFQVMVWKTFPKTKSLLNKIHYDAAVERRKENIKQRGKKENFITLFDECGSVIVSTDKKILDMVKKFKWTDFFVKNKTQFTKNIDCIVFGHAMYEKALTPYVGMTSHCLLILVEPDYFELSTQEKTQHIDDILSRHISKVEDLNTRTLTPLPILGIPNWHHDQTTDFYNDQSYFRPGRNKK